jgi:hypothetical protein
MIQRAAGLRYSCTRASITGPPSPSRPRGRLLDPSPIPLGKDGRRPHLHVKPVAPQTNKKAQVGNKQ